ncbi:hypothetical protein ACFL20_02930 [Spirochaetota bacterium]
MIKKCLLFIIFIFLTGCCSKPWKKYHGLSKPDISFRTGSDGGYDIYVWKCRNKKRIAIYKFTASFTCKEPQKEESPCGTLTPIENKFKETPKKKVPEFLKWNEN